MIHPHQIANPNTQPHGDTCKYRCLLGVKISQIILASLACISSSGSLGASDRTKVIKQVRENPEIISHD
jgi:hypothetical protein